MATRIVRQTRKDADGDITALCNHGQSWSPRYKLGAISDIKNGVHVYRVRSASGPVVEVVQGSNGEYLRTRPDGNSSNNLDNLPNC